ncbi:hypothetical protein M9Y10_011099 [Tritrichomonas musculus]|uniref:PQ loop repeat family protein n=1 Tax=Tritrichomonas musculus TaxID=1915356 RepID=A0ABR2IMH0_9EUKA
MNSDHHGYDYSFSGFNDYTSQMNTASSGIWKVVGYALFFGTIISLVPQIYLLIKRRSSYGINPMTPFVSNFGQFILLLNIICLRSSDFLAFIQVNFFQSLPRLMTFINAFALWIFYLPVIVLTTIFFDREHRTNRTRKHMQNEWKFNLFFIFLNVFCSLLILSCFFFLVFATGIGSRKVTKIGKIFGTITVISVVIQYLPQFITTCRIRDNGSFSLLLLAIQAPGGTISAIFMAIGQSDHWSTWMSTFAASVQQFCLLFLCIIFKLQKRRKAKYDVPLLSQISSTPSVVDPALSDKRYLE